MGRDGARLDSDARAPARARAQVADACKGLPDDVVSDVLLLTTELVDNALWHGEGPPGLDVAVGDTSVVVGVTDRGAGTVRPAPAYSWPETGHGLRLVAALADSWGVETTSQRPGKRVWFEVSWSEPRHRGE